MTEELNDVVAWLGPHCHFVQYPLRQGEMLNQVAVFRSPGYLRGDPEWGGEDELDEAYAACCEPIKQAASTLWRNVHWAMFDREPTQNWSDGRTLLIGDAAHPMLQYLAQGACQAIEDVAALESSIIAASERSADAATLWPGAFDSFIAERAPRTARVQRTARMWGESWHVEGIGRTLRNELFTRRDPSDYRYTDWLYGANSAGAR